MKQLSYYQTTSVSIPNQDNYITTYYYKNGVMIEIKVGKRHESFQSPNECVEENVLDQISYDAHLKHYQEENLRLQNEFRIDLIEKYGMTNHPKANIIFDKSWDYGSSSSLWDVEDYFVSLIELFSNDTLVQPQIKIS